MNAIAEYNIAQVREALKYDIDAIYFGDDWGMQRGLQMGPAVWHEYIYPVLKRMYGVVRDAGKYVMIHSCGDVDELFDDLIEIGLNCFNPFQPEVMDVAALLVRYRGRLAFYGGMSTQRTLPYGSFEDVRDETRRLLALGSAGGYVFSPAHDVEGDVPLENMLAFIEEVQSAAGVRSRSQGLDSVAADTGSVAGLQRPNRLTSGPDGQAGRHAVKDVGENDLFRAKDAAPAYRQSGESGPNRRCGPRRRSRPALFRSAAVCPAGRPRMRRVSASMSSSNCERLTGCQMSMSSPVSRIRLRRSLRQGDLGSLDLVKEVDDIVVDQQRLEGAHARRVAAGESVPSAESAASPAG